MGLSHLAAALAIAVTLFVTAPSEAALVYESATFGGSSTGGTAISATQSLGVRFELTSTTTVTDIGGNIAVSSSGNGLIFGAIVQLSDLAGFPNSTDLSSPDVLATATFGGSEDSADLIVPIGPIELPAGFYAVIFRSGLYGATGTGSMPGNDTNIGDPSYFFGTTTFWLDGGPTNARMTVYDNSITAIPAPAALTGGLALLSLAGLRRKRA